VAGIFFQGNPLTTNAELPAVGSLAPDFILVNSRLKNLSLAAFAGKRKVLNIVPSLDTPVCAASARKFNQKVAQDQDTVVLLVSADLPFAQCRFCTTEQLNNVVALSCFRSGFAEDYGVRLVDGILAGLTARAVIIIDQQNKIIYAELVKELTEEPDYEAALAVLNAH